MEYFFFQGYTSIHGSRRFAHRPPLIANINFCSYRTWDICVRKRNLCYYRSWDICVGTLHLEHPKDGSRGDGWIHLTDLNRKIKSPLNISRKCMLYNAKPILLIDIFSLFYINLLRMSDSFTDIISSLYVAVSRE